MKNKYHVQLCPKDKAVIDECLASPSSAEEKEFFEKIAHKILYEEAYSNDLLLSEHDNEDGIYIVRCYDYEFIIGRHVGEKFYEEVSTMNFADCLNTNLKEAELLDEDITLLEWLRKRNYSGIMYNHNFGLM